jgi:hypothetical protein
MIKILGFIPFLVAAAYGSVSDIEILLVVISSIGLIFSLYNLKESWKDWRLLKNLGKTDFGRDYDPRMVVALNGLRSEVSRSIIQAIYLALGIFAMLIAEAPPVHLPLKIVIFGFLFRWGFILASILLTLKSYWSYQVRSRVLAHYGFGDDPNNERDNVASRKRDLENEN